MTKLGILLAIVALGLLVASVLPGFNDAGAEMTAERPIEPAAELKTADQLVNRGRALFQAKGCMTCHQHDSLEAPAGQVSFAPNLSHYQPNVEFVRRWLADPAAIRPETQMPNLHLSEDEITALIAFLERASQEGVETLTAGHPPESCPVTRPPDRLFKPPSPYPAEPADENYFWYGSETLWTMLSEDGVWRELPQEDTGYNQKIVMWREGYDWREEPLPALTLTGRRLDGAAPPLHAHEGTNGYDQVYGSFMLSGVEIPTAGCWEIAGHYEGYELNFVVWVAP